MTPGELPAGITPVMQVLLDPAQLLVITTSIYTGAGAIVGSLLALVFAVTWKG